MNPVCCLSRTRRKGCGFQTETLPPMRSRAATAIYGGPETRPAARGRRFHFREAASGPRVIWGNMRWLYRRSTLLLSTVLTKD
jgi:hypothetical protein